jgi:hypothetical protein
MQEKRIECSAVLARKCLGLGHGQRGPAGHQPPSAPILSKKILLRYLIRSASDIPQLPNCAYSTRSGLPVAGTMPNAFAVPIFFIVFRETIETGIVISVLLSFLKQQLGPEHDAQVYKKLRKQVRT